MGESVKLSTSFILFSFAAEIFIRFIEFVIYFIRFSTSWSLMKWRIKTARPLFFSLKLLIIFVNYFKCRKNIWEKTLPWWCFPDASHRTMSDEMRLKYDYSAHAGCRKNYGHGLSTLKALKSMTYEWHEHDTKKINVIDLVASLQAIKNDKTEYKARQHVFANFNAQRGGKAGDNQLLGWWNRWWLANITEKTREDDDEVNKRQRFTKSERNAIKFCRTKARK